MEAYTWQGPRLTSHHSRVEAPEAERQDFCFHSEVLPLSMAPHDETVCVGNIRRGLVRPSVALLQSHAVIISKSEK